MAGKRKVPECHRVHQYTFATDITQENVNGDGSSYTPFVPAHLQVYRPHITHILFITHRATGVFFDPWHCGWRRWRVAKPQR
jgi:hypothetical protein